MKYILMSVLFIFSCKEERKIIDKPIAAIPVNWEDILNHKIDSLRSANIKAVEHIYMNAWIDGANAIIESVNENKHVGNSWIQKRSVDDSTKFSNDFRKRNNLK